MEKIEMHLKKHFLHTIILTILTLYQTVCSANPKGMVNILTQYTYLRSPEINSLVKNRCGVEISYDEYYGSNECLKRISTTGDFYYYDIVIFPSDIYELIKKKIQMGNSDLNKAVKMYNRSVRDHYLSRHYSGNIVYFVLSLSGFVWNPDVITLSTNDTIDAMFEKAKNNIVVINNSYSFGMWSLINNHMKFPPHSFTEAFQKTIRDTDIYITSGYNNLYNKDGFAFAFQQSGEAVYIIKASENKKLSFFVHPKYSYISSTMLAELNTRPETNCVARILASKEALDIVQRNTYYLSPYGTYSSVDDPVFQNIYKKLSSDLHKIPWLDSLFAKNTNGYLSLREMWDNINLLPQVTKNHSLVLKRKTD